MVELIHFNQDEYIEGDNLQERFGLRGRNMLQLAELHTPIAPGFLIESSTLTGGNLEEQRPDLSGGIRRNTDPGALPFRHGRWCREQPDGLVHR